MSGRFRDFSAHCSPSWFLFFFSYLGHFQVGSMSTLTHLHTSRYNFSILLSFEIKTSEYNNSISTGLFNLTNSSSYCLVKSHRKDDTNTSNYTIHISKWKNNNDKTLLFSTIRGHVMTQNKSTQKINTNKNFILFRAIYNKKNQFNDDLHNFPPSFIPIS